MNFHKQTNTESKPVVPTNLKIDNQYRLIELYVDLYLKHKISGVPFDVEKLVHSELYDTFIKDYKKRVEKNMCSFLPNDEYKILFDILIDLAEIFTPFIRDNSITDRQRMFYHMQEEDKQKEKETNITSCNNLKVKNLLFLVELFSKYRLKYATMEELVKASQDLECKNPLENGHGFSMIKHDKATNLNNLIFLLEEQTFDLKDLLRKGGVK